MVVNDVDDPWFPVTNSVEEGIEAAQAACGGCPVMRECRELTFREERDLAEGHIHGVRGGLSALQRRAVYRRMPAQARRGDVR
jgi:hypothetical protein